MNKIIGLFLFVVCSAFGAGNVLLSNYAFVALPFEKGKLLVFSRGDSNGGFSLLSLNLSGEALRVGQSEITPLDNDVEYTAVHDGILVDALAEHRRTPHVLAGKLGAVFPLYGIDSTGSFRKPLGIISMRGATQGSLTYLPLETPNWTYSDTSFASTSRVLSGFAYDSSNAILWIARGRDGLLAYDISKGLGLSSEKTVSLNVKTGKLDSLKRGASLKISEYPEIFDVEKTRSGELLLATSSGLWRETSPDSRHFVRDASIGEKRVTGVWAGGSPEQIIAESARQLKGSLENKLWRSYAKKSFSEVAFRDTSGKTIKNVYDRTDYSVSDVAFIGSRAFVAVRAVGGSSSGLLKLDSLGAIPWENENQWLYGFDAGVVDRNVIILSVSSFEMSNGGEGLAVSTYGNGLSVSADSGGTWTTILNQASVGKNLSDIRMVPSVISAGGESLVAYNLSKDAEITIEVFSYDMKKIRTIVKNAPRAASAARSSEPSEDFFDGKDDYGRAVSMGIYYVRVKDNHGHVGWGKVMTLGGKR